ncbi:L,D-transpeptidase family protein [Algirhabdus cladophorae]|uniref:L,D-transpeptidase family protein n=1 Tax=Algirhabdus cladophorae TaxID=3377108 RepID=UPI003B848F7B
MTPQDLVLTPRGVRFQNTYFPCSIGKGGLTSTKREGDGATPRGIHRIVATLYRPDRLLAPNPWAVPINPGDLWSDDSLQPDYNSLVRNPYAASHEQLRRADPLYDIVLITDWNWPDATPYAGSAIFLHQWRRAGYGTEGCVAFRRDHLRWITSQITPETRLIVP